MSSISDDTSPLTQIEIDQRVFDLYDEYCHGRIDRREFLTQAAAVTRRRPRHGAGAAAALCAGRRRSPSPIRASRRSYVSYPSPGGTSGTMRGYLVQPAGNGPFPAVLVIHENRGLNPYIEDVARRAAVEGFLALAPDGLFPVGGYPGNDDDGRTLQAKPRSGQAAHRHAEQRALSQGAPALDGQARRHRLLLGRQHDELPRRRRWAPTCRLACRSMAPRPRPPRAEDQGAAARSTTPRTTRASTRCGPPTRRR